MGARSGGKMERVRHSCAGSDFTLTLDHGERYLAVVGGGGRRHDALEHRERRVLVTHDGDFPLRQIFLRGVARTAVVLLLELVAQRCDDDLRIIGLQLETFQQGTIPS